MLLAFRKVLETEEMRVMARRENAYWCLQMLSVLTLVARLFAAWEFQSRLSRVIRTLQYAAVSLVHFFLVDRKSTL